MSICGWGEYDRKFKLKETTRIAEVKIKIPYVRYTSLGTATATTGFDALD